MQDTDTYPGRLLRIGEVAQEFQVTVPTVRAWADAGKIKAYRTLGNQRRFRESDITALTGGEAA